MSFTIQNNYSSPSVTPMSTPKDKVTLDARISALKIEIGARRALIQPLAQQLVQLKTAKEKAPMGSLASLEIGQHLATAAKLYGIQCELLAPFEQEVERLLSLVKPKPAEQKKKEAGEFVFKIPKPRPPKQIMLRPA